MSIDKHRLVMGEIYFILVTKFTNFDTKITHLNLFIYRDVVLK